MSITKTNIISEVALRTGRSQAEVRDNLIKSVLQDILITIPALHSEYTTETVKGQKEYDFNGLPIGDIVAINIGDKEPLSKISSMKEYKALIAEQGESEYDEPTHYLIEGQYVYLFPIPKDVYDLNVLLSDIDLSVDDIKLPDKYFECLVEGVCFKVYESKGLASKPEAQAHSQIYGRLLVQLEAQFSGNKNRGSTRYRDI